MEEGSSVKLLDNQHKPRHALVLFLDDNQLAKIVASTIVDYYSRTRCFKHDDTCKVERKKKYRDARILMLDSKLIKFFIKILISILHLTEHYMAKIILLSSYCMFTKADS